MYSSINDAFSNIENQCIDWLRFEDEQTKQIQCQIEEINLVVVISRGYFLHQHLNPIFFEHIINITSNDNENIKLIFENCMLKQKNFFIFPKCENERFRMRFFLNKDLLEKKLQEEESINGPYKKARNKTSHRCLFM